MIQAEARHGWVKVKVGTNVEKMMMLETIMTIGNGDHDLDNENCISDIFVQKLGCNKAQEEPAEEGLRERSLGEPTILSSSSKRSLSE